jgi:hypothetical protein
MIRKITLLSLLCLGLWSGLAAQTQGDTLTPHIWQLSGMVVSKNSREPVPFATVKVYHSRRSITSNAEGFYSLPVMEDDTIVFVALGYKTSFLVMSQYLQEYMGNKEGDYLYAINYLPEDSIQLATVTIFPYNTPEALRTAMIEANSLMPLEEQYARNNLDPKLLDELVKTMPVDGEERVAIAQRIYLDQAMHRNVVPTASINPLAIYQLLKYLNDKAREKRDKDLNYWEEE